MRKKNRRCFALTYSIIKQFPNEDKTIIVIQ